VVGNLVLSGADRHTPLILHDLGTGASSRLRWPSRPDYGLGEVSGDPNGRLAIVEFAKYSPEHRVDLWLLDTRTRRWQHLPGMPAPMVPKITDVQWTTDGRVVVPGGQPAGGLAARRVAAGRRSGAAAQATRRELPDLVSAVAAPWLVVVCGLGSWQTPGASSPDPEDRCDPRPSAAPP
jgi:hypothetical protein